MNSEQIMTGLLAEDQRAVTYLEDKTLALQYWNHLAGFTKATASLRRLEREEMPSGM